MPFDLDAFRRNALSDPLVQDIWNNKYRWKPQHGSPEKSIEESQRRVVHAIYKSDESQSAFETAMEMILNGYFLPAGRINAGAGTERAVTLLNCYVGDIMQDSMPGIQLAIAKSAFTLQQGGGIGNDFSTLRPAGALVKRTGSVSSGAVAFMHQMSTMSDTICSAGERRGAMMTTLADWHADLWHEDQFETVATYTGEQVLKNPSFISVKRQKGKLTQTNISVLISNAFMAAVRNDTDWDLGFWTPRADGNHVDVYNKPFPYDYREVNNNFESSWLAQDIQGRRKGEMLPFYVYTRVKARRIWDDLMHSTYKYAEPGVIFIDRINERNNLNYCETISCTNPCGEQPLPAHGTCCLGSVNVAFMVKDPFTATARLDVELFKRAIHCGVRFLDNVLDVANYPLEEQRVESMNKRRIGLGLTGVADAMLQLGDTYGAERSILTMRSLAMILKQESYLASAMLAKERGAFPAYDRKFLDSWNVRGLPISIIKMIADTGIRNGVLNTEAPNGTISIYSGNTAQGIEPVFTFKPMLRKVRQPDGSLIEYASVNYSQRLYIALEREKAGERLWEAPVNPGELPDYFVSAMTITPEAHIEIQAACQEYIDASISKTINCPTEMTFHEMREVYELAYDRGCKGCTTYRYDPDAGRGSVLSLDATEQDNGDLSITMPEGGTVTSINVDGHEIPINPRQPTAEVEALDNPPEVLAIDAAMAAEMALARQWKIQTPGRPEFDYIALADSQGQALDQYASKAFGYVDWATAVKADPEFFAPITCRLITEPPPAVSGFTPLGDTASPIDEGLTKGNTLPPFLQRLQDHNDRYNATIVKAPKLTKEAAAELVKRWQDLPPGKRELIRSEPLPDVRPSQRLVEGRRYKLKWPTDGSNWYINITRHEGEPFEVFISTASADNAEWVQALSRLLTAILRRGGDVRFLINELAAVHSAHGGAFIAEQHKYRPSLVAAIGGILEEEFRTLGMLGKPQETLNAAPHNGDTVHQTGSKIVPVTVTFGAGGPDACPECGATPLVHEQGCKRCLHCAWSNCG